MHGYIGNTSDNCCSCLNSITSADKGAIQLIKKAFRNREKKEMGNTHVNLLPGGLGHGDGPSQPGRTLDPLPRPHLVLSTPRHLGHDPQRVVSVGAVHVISELDAYLRSGGEDGAEQPSVLLVGDVVTLVVNVESLWRGGGGRQRVGMSYFSYFSDLFFLKQN